MENLGTVQTTNTEDSNISAGEHHSSRGAIGHRGLAPGHFPGSKSSSSSSAQIQTQVDRLLHQIKSPITREDRNEALEMLKRNPQLMAAVMESLKKQGDQDGALLQCLQKEMSS